MLVLIADPNDQVPELTASFRGIAVIHGPSRNVIEYPRPYTDKDLTTGILLAWFKMSIT
jgi:hypothetical protein